MLNGVDGDTDLEPSPGFSNGGYRPEDQTQEGIGFYMNYNHGPDLEDEHCGAESGDDSEPDVDGEHGPGRGPGDSQTGQWSIVTVDPEHDVGPIHRKRRASMSCADASS